MTGQRWAMLLVAGLLALAGCGPSGGAAGGSRELTVFAAASLTEVFGTLGPRFEKRHGAEVRFSFGSSAALAQQIAQGAPADVYAAADRRTMVRVTDAGLAAGEPRTFARNRLQIAVPAGNPGKVRGIADLARRDLAIALCAKQAPCGAASAVALRAAGVTARPDTYAKDVKAVLSKVRLGEVDAALVYRTDVRAAGDTVTGIDFPEAARAVNDYPVAALDGAADPELAGQFVAYLRSAPAQRALTAAGFALP